MLGKHSGDRFDLTVQLPIRGAKGPADTADGGAHRIEERDGKSPGPIGKTSLTVRYAALAPAEAR